MLPSYQNIKKFFYNNGINISFYINKNEAWSMSNQDTIHFSIRSDKKGYIFRWVTKDENRGEFNKKFPKIRKWCNSKNKKCEIKAGIRNHKWRRIYIEVDTNDPLKDSLKIVNATKNDIGWTGVTFRP